MTSIKSYSCSLEYIFFFFTHGWLGNKATHKGVFKRIWYKLYSHDPTSFPTASWKWGTSTFVDCLHPTGIAVRTPELIYSPRTSLQLIKELVQASCPSAAAQGSRQGATGCSGLFIPGLSPIFALSGLLIEQSPEGRQRGNALPPELAPFSKQLERWHSSLTTLMCKTKQCPNCLRAATRVGRGWGTPWAKKTLSMPWRTRVWTLLHLEDGQEATRGKSADGKVGTAKMWEDGLFPHAPKLKVRAP